MSMKLLFLIVCLVHSHGSSSTAAEGKRYDYQSMVDPLTRRSPLDKNFMRFGRSSTPPEEEPDDSGLLDDSTSKPEEDLHRLNRGKDNFIRFGRSEENDNDLDNFLRTERARQDNFIRFGRGRDVQNFIRFGRGRENFMRFGRGRSDNFMRFGKSQEVDPEDSISQKATRSGTKGSSNFMRFGRGDDADTPEELDSTSIYRNTRGKNNNFLRFGRGNKNSGFIRFGRSGNERNFMRFGRNDDLSRTVRSYHDKNNNFMRFGRSEKEKDGDMPRNKRSSEFIKNENEVPLYQLKDFSCNPESRIPVLPYDLDEEFEGTSRHEELWSRKKRSIDDDELSRSKPSENIENNVPQQLHFKTSPLHYYPSPLSAGLPNFIVGPEFSLLPPLDIPAKLKRGKNGNQNFIRLG